MSPLYAVASDQTFVGNELANHRASSEHPTRRLRIRTRVQDKGRLPNNNRKTRHAWLKFRTDFMRYQTQDPPAGRIQPSRFDNAPKVADTWPDIFSVDTKDLPYAHSELVRPKRPAILRRALRNPATERSGILRWVAGFTLSAIILAGVIGHYSQSLKAPATLQPDPVLQHSLEILQRPVPTPAQPISQPPVPPPPAIRAPRATLVRLSAPPLRLTELTPEHIDETHQITLPYGTEVLATLRGFLKNENQLPQIGRIGDMYVVGDVPWIWIQVPGTPAPTWVDP